MQLIAHVIKDVDLAQADDGHPTVANPEPLDFVQLVVPLDQAGFLVHGPIVSFVPLGGLHFEVDVRLAGVHEAVFGQHEVADVPVV